MRRLLQHHRSMLRSVAGYNPPTIPYPKLQIDKIPYFLHLHRSQSEQTSRFLRIHWSIKIKPELKER